MNPNNNMIQKILRLIWKYMPKPSFSLRSLSNPSSLSSLASLFQTVKNLSPRTIAYSITFSMLSYFSYRAYEYRKYKERYFIDLIEMRKGIAWGVWEKEGLKWIGIGEKKDSAIEKYEQGLREGMKEIIQKIKDNRGEYVFKKNNSSAKITLFSQQPSQQESSSSPSPSSPRPSPPSHQFLLSKSLTSSLSLFSSSPYPFHLHSKYHITTITNNGFYTQKTFTIPLIIGGVPFFGKVKQNMRKIKGKWGDFVQKKQKVRMESQCKGILEWESGDWKTEGKGEAKGRIAMRSQFQQSYDNFYEDDQDEQVIVQQIGKNQQDATRSVLVQNNSSSFYQEIVSTQQKKASKNNNPKLSKNQLLLECRTRIKKLQNQLMKQVKDIINQHWQSSTKPQSQSHFDDPFNSSQFSLSNVSNAEKQPQSKKSQKKQQKKQAYKNRKKEPKKSQDQQQFHRKSTVSTWQQMNKEYQQNNQQANNNANKNSNNNNNSKNKGWLKWLNL